jgi:hypothetical protein
MRFVKNDVQTPVHLVSQDKRKKFVFYLLLIGIIVLVGGALVFFSAFFIRDMIFDRWGVNYWEVQTKAIYVAAVGMFTYIGCALVLRIPLRKTTYYKLNTIVKNEPFDPPRKGDFTKVIFARLYELNDEWALFAEVKPQGFDFKIPQVVVGPGGVFTIHPISDNPERRAFKDPGKLFDQASKKLGSAIDHAVLPIVVFSSPKLVTLYREKHAPKTKVMNILEVYKFFADKKKVLTAQQCAEAEAKIYELIEGTPPGE